MDIQLVLIEDNKLKEVIHRNVTIIRIRRFNNEPKDIIFTDDEE